ncbi:hypothetical protein [Methanoregula sp. PtaB.Bin085]|uniref:hypothetical protein n=1 Tax=Methanoregula sp. PtaB.Bin085 TaxID=1811680 RepID=UPI0009D332CC|nr:hypothetical protein [Methanoregula sp. PtaB.Bin085]OPX64818.1 MAG: hypothetical protein A4E33_00556 [Methanoregula sp. PtaB.Bin085]
MSDVKPCCAAEALRRIRQIPINGIMTGITMLDECIADVKKQNLGNESAVSEALMKKIRVYNYVPPGVAEAYTRAIMEEYNKSGRERGP